MARTGNFEVMKLHWSLPKEQFDREITGANPENGNFRSHFHDSIAVCLSYPPVAPVTAKPVVAKPVAAKQAPAKPVTAKPVFPPVASPSAAPPHTPAPKPPTPPEDPAVIAARRAARIEATRVVLQEIMARWPQTFTANPVPVRPLASGMG